MSARIIEIVAAFQATQYFVLRLKTVAHAHHVGADSLAHFEPVVGQNADIRLERITILTNSPEAIAKMNRHSRFAKIAHVAKPLDRKAGHARRHANAIRYPRRNTRIRELAHHAYIPAGAIQFTGDLKVEGPIARDQDPSGRNAAIVSQHSLQRTGGHYTR